MKLTNIGGFKTIDQFVEWKLKKLEGEDKSFRTLFSYMFMEGENVFAEHTDGYRVHKVTYAEGKRRALRKANALASALTLPPQSLVGLYLDNGLEWLEVFWAILARGYRPLLINRRLPEAVVEGILADFEVQAVVSDGKEFACQTVLASSLVSESEADVNGVWGEEVLFMSSGTTENVKLCAYTAENFFYQVANSVDILKRCPQIAAHYEGELKLLTLLPFYHVFGFIAVYLWFGFFSRTFVFLKDLNPQTIQNTVKKHKVTHIFAVPLVWETVCRSAKRKIKERGEKVYQKFKKGIKTANASAFGAALTKKAMREVREGLFGESVKFLISGGSAVSSDALAFFNGIGYFIVNGYGMTEVGITSVEVSPKAAVRNLGAIGSPFFYTEYAISEKGELLIRGKNTASRILQGKQETLLDGKEWFNSKDLADCENGRYFVRGRRDDLIVSASGENLNPTLVEAALTVEGADAICLVLYGGAPTLLVSSSSCYSVEQVKAILDSAKSELSRARYDSEIHDVLITPDKLIDKTDFKLSRRKIAKKLENGEITLLSEGDMGKRLATLLEGMEREIALCFADALRLTEDKIGKDMHFFTDLGGTSLDYFMMADAVRARFGVDVKSADGVSLCTVNDIASFIKRK